MEPRPRGRPPLDPEARRSVTLRVRVRPSQHAALEAWAGAAQLPVGTLCQRILNSAITEKLKVAK